MNSYQAHVTFRQLTIVVTAKNRAEAQRKVHAKLARRKPERLIDRANTYLDRLV